MVLTNRFCFNASLGPQAASLNAGSISGRCLWMAAFLFLGFLLPCLTSHPVRAVELRQVVSREHPAITGAGQGLDVGPDGNVYVYGGRDGEGYVLRISLDGRQKFGARTTYAVTGVAAGNEGTFATSNAHFAKSVSVYGSDGVAIGKVGGFTGNDEVGWDGPGTIEAGSSGDFFALDQHARRIVRIDAGGRTVRSYPLTAGVTPGQPRLWTYGFRVHEPSEQFYLIVGNQIECRGFDGDLRWSVPSQIGGDPWGGFSGGFDVDADGRLYVCNGLDATIHLFDEGGRPAGELMLEMEDRTAGPQRRITHLRVADDALVIRQQSDTEVFQVYDRATGSFRHAVSIEHERLTVSYPEPVWIAGEDVSLQIQFDAAGRDVAPRLAAWIRPLGTVEFEQLAVAGQRATVSADLSGLFHLRVGSGLGGSESEYQVDSVIEIRPPDAAGSISIYTLLNRRSWRRGEPIPFAVRCRTTDATRAPAEIEIRLLDRDGGEHHRQSMGMSTNEVVSIELPPELTADLEPGDYRLTALLPGWTIADQHLAIGDGKSGDGESRFYHVRHGDYSLAYPDVAYFNAPERIARHVAAAGRIGENLFVDRLGHSTGLGELEASLRDAELIARLAADPVAVAPEKAEFENRILQTIAAYGAAGIEQRAILLYMDAGLPLGTLFDQRPPDQMEQNVATVTRRLADYPAFGGWSWAANWWIEKRGAELAASPEERAAYEAALKGAHEEGHWDPVLETVSNRWIQQAVEAEQRLSAAMQRALEQAATPDVEHPRGRRDLVSAMTGPYRQPGIIPPITFANADEVDLHFQAEQIQWPMISAHNVDFYRRPGKPAWGHPELWNDDGTGAQILSSALQMVMRGADGVGQSGSTKGFAAPPSDPRGMGPGATSVHRQLNAWLAAYGPWLAETSAVDPIAIPVSTRMMRLELGWQGIGGFYFTRLFEAYNACLRAHRPATFLFAEDCTPESFRDYRAVLLVSQTVELDPPLQVALQTAADAGLPIYTDPTCRTELLAGLSPRPLEIDFTHIERDHHVLNDDSAFWRYRETMLAHAAALESAWGELIPPIADCDRPEVLLTERRYGDVRLLWAVNDTAIPLEPGQLWRVSLAAGSRMPVAGTLHWPAAEGRQVVELFSGARSDGPSLQVDLIHAPARVFVALPPEVPADSLSQYVPRTAAILETEPFAARLRDLCISDDQQTALVTAAGWDRNAFSVDLLSGVVTRQQRIGHHFAYAPQSTPTGFAVQGYDLNTSEGYHLYLLNPATSLPERRVALFGLPKRGTSWASARQWQEPINQFAVAPDGSWIASAGDLGLAVWSRDGQLRWSDQWWASERRRPLLAPLGNEALVSLEGNIAAARSAAGGEVLWTHQLGESGRLTGAVATPDGQTLAILSTDNGGRVFILRNGRLVNSLATLADELVLSPDGSLAAVTDDNQLKLFDSARGLVWSITGDDILRAPRFDAPGRRIVAGSELGTLYVMSTDGQGLLERDCGALPVARWLDDGGLLVANWMGRLTRLDSQFEPRWSIVLSSDAAPDPDRFLAADEMPTSRISDWGNSAAEPAPLASNLLAETEALIEAWCDPPTHGDPRTWQHDVNGLRDADPAPPAAPWLEWSDISYLDSGWREKLAVQVDTFRSQLRVTGITIVENPDHPESWTRDMRLQWWDAGSEVWQDGPYLLYGGDDPTHTHWFNQPVEAARFRFVSTGGASWPVGNIRWGELVFHGEATGPSHPDAVANRPVAVLFDEREVDLRSLMTHGDHPFEFRYDDAFSGGKCLALSRAGATAPHWKPPFGHVLPNWDFSIVEEPRQPGEYRWLEFAWKASSAETTGLTLRLGPHHGGGVSLTAGQAAAFEGAIEDSQAAAPPHEWTTIRVDLWELHRREPFAIRSISLGATGGGGLFDNIRLARSPTDLD